MLRRIAVSALALVAASASAQSYTPGAPSSGYFSSTTPTVLGLANIAASSLALGGGSAGAYDTGNAEGWVVQSAAAAAGQTFAVTRQGYTTAAVPTTYADTFTITKKLRQTFPNQGLLNTNNLWALSDYVLTTDAPTGFANNSTLTAPKPVCNWDEPSRSVVGAGLHVGIVCFSRDARNQSEVAAVVVTATDGTTTVSSTIGAMTKSTYGGDVNAVIDYEATIDVSPLADNHIVTVNAKAYPWIGDSRSVLDSAASTVLREFSPRYYLKNTTKFASPPIAYVCLTSTSCPAQTTPTAGNDTTGVWSTTAATALATPFASMAGAENAATNASRGILAVNGGVGTGNGLGYLDGAVIRIGAGTNIYSGLTVNQTQQVAALVVTRDPAVTRAQAIVSTDNARYRLSTAGSLVAPITETAVRYKDLTLLRNASYALTSAVGPDTDLILDNITYDNGSTSYGAMLVGSHLYAYGVTALNVGLGTFASSAGAAANETRILRGVSGGYGNYEGWLLLGSALTYPAGIIPNAKPADASIVAFNSFFNPNNGSSFYSIDANTPRGIVFVQNLVETLSTNSANGTVTLGADGGTGSVTGMIVQYNTITGASIIGRTFFGYDQTINLSRVYKLPHIFGNIFPMVFNKTDQYDGVANADTSTGAGAATNRTGSWPLMYGVANRNNLYQFVSNSSGGFGGDREFNYPGIGAQYVTGANDTIRLDPKFVTDNATKITLNADPQVAASYYGNTGGGDYHLQATSPCKGALATSLLPYGLDGTARPTTGDSCGAYP